MKTLSGKLHTTLIIALLALLSAAAPAMAQEKNPFEMSLDELLSVKVMSVTRLADQSLFDSPAALYVITDEDIRRSGHLDIPDILRLAPALQVGRMDAGAWAISARGFNNRYNRLQLVQMDGRAITNNLFGGVYWANQDYVIPDLERIEVISGPGTSLWGANAVNGVISIISKPAKDTQGWLVESHTGNKDTGIGAVRYGGRLGDNSWFRMYAKHQEHDHFDTYAFNNAQYNPPYVNQYTPDKSDDVYSYQDNFRRQQLGFRADWENGDTHSFTLQGDYFRMLQGDSIAYATYTVLMSPLGTQPTGAGSPKESDGWNLLGRWTRKFSDTSQMQVQAYLDWNSQEYLNPVTPYSDKRRVSDLDFQHNFLFGNHSIVWGAEYKQNRMRMRNNIMTFVSATDSFNNDVLSGFAQDSFRFLSPEIKMTLGAKVERNDFTGGETQPSMRLTYTPNDRNAVWSAVSKAVKVPGPETLAQFTVGGANVLSGSLGGGQPLIDLWMPFTLVGNANVSEEEVVAYELGYRTRPSDSLSLDVTLFANRGHHMQRTEKISSVPYVVRLISSGTMHYEGAELNANWILTDKWRLMGGYTWFDADEKAVSPVPVGDETPRNQAQVRSYLDVGHNWELNSALYYKDNIRHEDNRIPRSVRMDLGVTWKDPEKNIECKIVGQNLFDPKFREAAPDRYSSLGAAEVERSVYVQMLWNR